MRENGKRYGATVLYRLTELVRKTLYARLLTGCKPLRGIITLGFQALGVKARLDNSRMRLQSRYISLRENG